MWQVALQTAAFALAKDCHSITFTPGYQSTVETPLHAGGNCTQIRLRASNGWQIDLDEVQAAIREDTRYIVINQPYNPAGTLMSPELHAELIAIADAHGIYILSDEVYRLLEHDPKDRLSAMADAYHRGISVVTVSKPWGARPVCLAHQRRQQRLSRAILCARNCALPHHPPARTPVNSRSSTHAYHLMTI